LTTPRTSKLIESDDFPFEFLSQLAERESWRKEIHRPIYHVHKWWAKRLGSVFRGILLGCMLPDGKVLAEEFYRFHDFAGHTVFDPFMGSGTTIGEAHKLGFAALGRDINPVAVDAVSTALGPMDRRGILESFEVLSRGVGKTIRELYRTKDPRGRTCEVLYFFWVMQVPCPECAGKVDLFPSYVIARNAYPHRKTEVQFLCPGKTRSFAERASSGSIPRPGMPRGRRHTADAVNVNSPFSTPWAGLGRGRVSVCTASWSCIATGPRVISPRVRKTWRPTMPARSCCGGKSRRAKSSRPA
jgi:adenine-specific DNA methylase